MGRAPYKIRDDEISNRETPKRCFWLNPDFEVFTFEYCYPARTIVTWGMCFHFVSEMWRTSIGPSWFVGRHEGTLWAEYAYVPVCLAFVLWPRGPLMHRLNNAVHAKMAKLSSMHRTEMRLFHHSKRGRTKAKGNTNTKPIASAPRTTAGPPLRGFLDKTPQSQTQLDREQNVADESVFATQHAKAELWQTFPIFARYWKIHFALCLAFLGGELGFASGESGSTRVATFESSVHQVHNYCCKNIFILAQNPFHSPGFQRRMQCIGRGRIYVCTVNGARLRNNERRSFAFLVSNHRLHSCCVPCGW